MRSLNYTLPAQSLAKTSFETPKGSCAAAPDRIEGSSRRLSREKRAKA
jgi:hypothetical protein